MRIASLLLRCLGLCGLCLSLSAEASTAVSSTDWLMNQIEFARGDQRYDIQKDALTRLYREHPENYSVLLELYKLEALSNGDPKVAEKLFNELCRRKDSAYCKKAREHKAARTGEKLLAYNRALLASKGGRYQEAADILAQAFGLDPLDDDIRLLFYENLLQIPEKRDAALAMLSSLIKKEPDNLFFTWRASGLVRKYEVEKLSEFGLDNAYVGGQREKAIEALEKCLRLAPSDPRAARWQSTILTARYWLQMNRGDDLYDRRRLKDAEKYYREAIEANPESPYGYLGLANIASDRHRFKEARHWLLEALARSSKSSAEERRRILGKLDSLKVRVLEAQADRLAKEKKVREESEVLQKILKLDPDSPWVAYRLANAYIAMNEPDKARKVFQSQPKRRLNASRWAYPWGLVLSSLDDYEEGLRFLKALPKKNADIRNLIASMEQRMQIQKASALADKGEFDKAIEVLNRVENLSGYNLKLLADWSLETGKINNALCYYLELKKEPDYRIDALFGLLQIALTSHDENTVREALKAFSEEDLRGLRPDQIMDVAQGYVSIQDRAKANSVYESATKRVTEPQDKAQLLRKHAELLESGQEERALRIYSDAFRTLGLQKNLYDTEEENFTHAMLTPDEEADWLTESLRSRASSLYERLNPTITAELWISRDPGTKGYSDISMNVGILQADLPYKGGVLTLRNDAVFFNVGALRSERYQLFGYCYTFECRGPDYASPINKDFGNSFAVAWRNQRWKGDLGTTPIGFKYSTIVGSLGYQWDKSFGSLGLSVYRRPKDASLLSFGGQRDPITGLTWGGVIRNGLEVSGSYNLSERSGLWWFGNVEFLRGHRVPNNLSTQWMGGYYYQLIRRPNHRFIIGASAMYWHFDKNQSLYTFGSGGYYSPQHYLSGGMNLRDYGRTENFSWDLQLRLGLSMAKKKGLDRYPIKAYGASVIPSGMVPVSASSITDLYAGESGSNETGIGWSIAGAFERRLGPHFVLGGAAEYQSSDAYTPFWMAIWLRYYWERWRGDVRMPPEPLLPYSKW